MNDTAPAPDGEQARLKLEAAKYAVQLVKSGMIVGLGSGSTAVIAIEQIGARLAAGELRDIVGLPTSLVVERKARALGIPLVSLENPPMVDLTIDGADEVDPDLNLIKGGGGALLREKVVAQLSYREVIIVDESKQSPKLGTKHFLPVEVIPFAWGAQSRFLMALGATVTLRRNSAGQISTTDQGNYTLDCQFGPIPDALALAKQLSERAGIVEHGLFLDLATDLILASKTGVQHLQRAQPKPFPL